MMMFVVHVPVGPTVMVAANSFEEVKAYIESRLPMRKRWTGQWCYDDGHWTYTRVNRWGRRVTRYEIKIATTNKKEYVR